MNGDKEQQKGSPGQPDKPGEEGSPAPRPREISREEIDHQQPQDADPDDPVSP